jgi:hypothetical protein
VPKGLPVVETTIDICHMIVPLEELHDLTLVLVPVDTLSRSLLSASEEVQCKGNPNSIDEQLCSQYLVREIQSKYINKTR